MSDQVLDVKGLKCPLPVLRANKRLKTLSEGDVLRVLSTDPGSVQDFKSYCETSGNELVSSGEDDGVFSFDIRKT